MKNIDRYKAVIWGLACGDALGKPTEFMGMDGIRSRFGENGIQHINQTKGLFTDDTQMAVALAEGLLDAHDNGVRDMAIPEDVMPYVAERFVEWAFGPKNNRAPGNTCMAGCRGLRDGKPWTESGVKNSKGCGSAMRAAPLGLVYKADQLKEISLASSLVTHGHQAAQEAAHVAALAVRLLLDGESPENLVERLLSEATDPDLRKLLILVEPYVKIALEHPDLIDTHLSRHGLGESWVGDEAVASALYCFLLAHERGEGYVETVRYGANTVGDSDSIACIAGSFAGAYWGLGKKGVPQDWIDKVEDTKELGDLAQRLYDLAHAQGNI